MARMQRGTTDTVVAGTKHGTSAKLEHRGCGYEPDGAGLRLARRLSLSSLGG